MGGREKAGPHILKRKRGRKKTKPQSGEWNSPAKSVVRQVGDGKRKKEAIRVFSSKKKLLGSQKKFVD